jgi:ATP-dependent helicase HrpA
MREWVLVHEQILSICEEQRIPLGRQKRISISDTLYSGIHKSILSGYLSNIAVLKEKNMYTAAKSREVMVFPGSALFGKSRPWIVASEMVKTTRLFARTVSRIDPEWLEELGGTLCLYTYADARWDRNRGEVVAQERVSLFGLRIIEGRPVSYGRINPEEAHKIFVQSALVEGDFADPPAFLEHNLALVDELADIEDRLRQRGYLAGEDKLSEFYSDRLPGISDVRSLRKRIKERGSDAYLKMTEADLLRIFPDEKELADYPGHMTVGELRLPLVYRFAPGEADDGVTLEVPVTMLGDISEIALEWGVPGLFREKVEALAKGLPKRYRKLLVPIAEKAGIIGDELRVKEESLFLSLAEFVRRRFQADIPASAWVEAEIPPHLRMRIAVIGPDGKELAASRDLGALKKRKWPSGVSPTSDRWVRAKQEWEREGIEEWDFGALPEKISVGPFVTAFPALEPAGQGANIRLFPDENRAKDSHRKGVRALFLLTFGKDLEFVRQYLALPDEMKASALYFGGEETMESVMMETLQREVFEKDIRDEKEFRDHTEGLIQELFERCHILGNAVQEILSAYQRMRSTMSDIEKNMGNNLAIRGLIAETKRDLEMLAPRDFLKRYSLARLRHVSRYLEALRLRLERARHDPAKDKTKSEQISRFVQALENLYAEVTEDTSMDKKIMIEEFRWMMEEFKVSLFAPELKTAHPISPKRLAIKLKAIRKLEDN